MKDKLLQIRVDEDFLSKLEYLQRINGFKTVSETVRHIVEKEFRKENESVEELINTEPSAEPEPHWIPVTERQPECSGWYIVTLPTTDNDLTLVSYMRYSTVHAWGCGEKPTAWMPLPEPYNPTGTP